MAKRISVGVRSVVRTAKGGKVHVKVSVSRGNSTKTTTRTARIR